MCTSDSLKYEVKTAAVRYTVHYSVCLIVNMQQSTVTSHFPGSQKPEQWHHKTAAFHRDCKCHEQWGKHNTHTHLGYIGRKPRHVRQWRGTVLTNTCAGPNPAAREGRGGARCEPSSQNHISLMAVAHGRPPASAVCQCPGSHRPKTNKHQQLDLHLYILAFSEILTHTQNHNYGIHLHPHKPLAWYGHIWTWCFVGHCVCVCVFAQLLILNLAEKHTCSVKRKNGMQPKAAGMQGKSIC